MNNFKVGDWVTDGYLTGRVNKVWDNYVTFPLGNGEIGGYNPESLTLVQPIYIRYLNYKGVQSWRKVIPLKTKFASSVYHNEGKPTWLLEAWDLGKEATRDFHMQDILELGKGV